MLNFLIFIVFASYVVVGQESKDILSLSLNHTVQFPAGDLKTRFGHNSNINGTVLYEFNEIILSAELGGIFGSQVKENNLFNAIDGNNGNLISQNGEIPTIRLFQRGGYMDVSIGKYIKIGNQQKSRIVISIGLGYLYHKIFIETLTTELPQLNNDIIKGYDRLCGGLFTKQFLGYRLKSEKSNVQFLIGCEFMQAFTKDLRQYNYTIQEEVSINRKDYLLGLKTGFIIPINQRKTGKYYYY